MDFAQIWPLPKTIESGFEAELSVRAFHWPAIRLLVGPDVSWGYYQVEHYMRFYKLTVLILWLL
jgi:hypothetical protein